MTKNGSTLTQLQAGFPAMLTDQNMKNGLLIVHRPDEAVTTTGKCFRR